MRRWAAATMTGRSSAGGACSGRSGAARLASKELVVVAVDPREARQGRGQGEEMARKSRDEDAVSPPVTAPVAGAVEGGGTRARCQSEVWGECCRRWRPHGRRDSSPGKMLSTSGFGWDWIHNKLMVDSEDVWSKYVKLLLPALRFKLSFTMDTLLLQED
ncbi:hypothetical protein ZWY2020_029355 [Hordeum vulgare]|nr:hypothetical protein ZWY2020_029355 [Hordeum vulgare]